MSTLAKAIDIAHTGFKYKADKGGQPYILHCFRVMNYLHTDAAAIHDLELIPATQIKQITIKIKEE